MTSTTNLKDSPCSSAVNFLRKCSLGIMLLVINHAVVAPVRAGCPSETFDYGPTCPEEAKQVVIDHYGPSGPLLPVPADCVRASRDMSLIRAAIPALVDVLHDSCCFQPKVLVIQTSAPEDAELACINYFYQVSFVPLFGPWWIVTFPHALNTPIMLEIYQAIPAVQIAELNSLGCAGSCCIENWRFTPLPNGGWHWSISQSVPFFGGCRLVIWNFYVTDIGDVILTGDVNCDGKMNVLDLPHFVDALLEVKSFSGCDVLLADLSMDGIVSGRDIRPFVEALLGT